VRVISWNGRFAIMALLLAGTAGFLQTRARNDVLPPGSSLASLPVQLGSWVGADIPIPQEILASLGPGEFVQRVYREQETGEAYVDLYLAHLPNEHALRRHLPQDCLIASGWSLAESGTTTLSLPGYPPFLANRYLITKGSDRQLVFFWFWAHGRRVVSEDWMDLYLTMDALRLNRKDNALIRINTGLRPGETADDAQRRLLSFAAQATPLLDHYISR
jgi:EpsI family protein